MKTKQEILYIIENNPYNYSRTIMKDTKLWNHILSVTNHCEFKTNGERINFYALDMKDKKCCEGTEYKFSEGEFTFCGKKCDRNKKIMSLKANIYNNNNITEEECNKVIDEINSIIPPGRETTLTYKNVLENRLKKYSEIESKIDLPIEYCLTEKDTNLQIIDENNFGKYFIDTIDLDDELFRSIKRLCIYYNNSIPAIHEFVIAHDKLHKEMKYITQRENISQILYDFVYIDKIPKPCEYGNEIIFNNFIKGYRKYCSSSKENSCKCFSAMISDVAKNNDLFSYEQISKKYKEKTGYDNPLQNPEVKEKIKQTNLEKYGTEHAIASDIVRDKIKQTNLEKYGYESPFESPEILKKAHDTNRNNNGDCFAVARKTYAETIGMDTIFQSEEWQNNIRQERLINNGSSSPLKIPGVQENMKQRELEKFGCEHHTQRLWSEETRQIILDENINWDRYVKENGGIDSTAQKLGVDWKVIKRKLIEQNPNYKSSKSSIEDAIEDFLIKNNIKYEKNNRKILKNGKELDFYLPDNNLAIEYHSLKYHTTDNEHIDIFYHYNKFKDCLDNDIKLLSIFQDNYFMNLDNIKKYILTLCNNVEEEINITEELLTIDEINKISYYDINEKFNRCFVSKNKNNEINGIITLDYNNEEINISNFFYNNINATEFLKLVLTNVKADRILFESKNDYFDFKIMENCGFKNIGNLQPKCRFVEGNYIIENKTAISKEIYDCGSILFLLEEEK